MRKMKVLSLMVLAVSSLFTACKKDEGDPIPASEIPIVISVAPAEGSVNTELTITGTNFKDGASVFVGDVLSAQVEIASTETIYALVPSGIAGNTLLDVKVKNTSGGEGTLKSAFKAINPVLSYINSATKPSGNIGSTVILEGAAFGDARGNGKIWFSDGAGGTVEAIIANAEDWTNTFIITTVPQGAEDGPVVVETEIGASNAMEFNVTESATFSPSAISWKLTTALPEALSGHKAVFAPIDDATNATNNYVFVTGGANSLAAEVSTVYAGKINADGTISEWSATAALPEPRAFHASIAATPFNSKAAGSGFVYVLGGINADGAPSATVSMGSLANDGTIASWSSTKPLPQPLHSAGAVIFRSTIYVAGGSTTDNVPVATVYKAIISETGELGDWETLDALPSARTYHGFVTFGGFLYAVGGETGNVTPEDATYTANETKLGEVVFAKINLRTGNLTSGWTVNGNSLQKSRSKHTALIAGGSLFVSSGLYSGGATGSSENTYAQISSDGTVGSFAGATGSNTLLSTGGANLFNQDGISYIDANGVSHVMIIGGDNLALPGTKQANVIYY